MHNVISHNVILKMLYGIVCFVLLYNGSANAQCTPQVRNYATIQQSNTDVLTNIDNPAYAVDGDITTAATMSRLLGVGSLITVTQFIKFSSPVAAGTAVTIKLAVPPGLLALLGGVEVQPFTNLNKPALSPWTADAAGRSYTGATLLAMLNGAGDQDITITPQTSGGTPVTYDGLWIKMGGIAVAQSIGIYGAYTLQDATGGSTVGCNVPVDVISGIRAGTFVGDVATITSAVTNPRAAIDADPTQSTYATLNVVEVLSEVYHTTLFNVPSQPGDMVRMVLQNPGGGLLNLGLLSGFTIQLYNRNLAVGPPITSSSSGLLSLSLLSGSAGNEKYELLVTPPASAGAFDRVEVKMGGIGTVGLVQGLRIYDVKRIVATPTMKVDGQISSSKNVCSGSTATFSIENKQMCTTYKWYDAATGGNLLHTDSTYTPTPGSLHPTNPNQYYVEAVREGCSEVSIRTPVTLNVNPLPGITISTVPHVCTGSTTTYVSYTGSNSPNTYSIAWDATAASAGFANVNDEALPADGNIPVVVPAGTSPGTYNGSLTVKNAGGCISSVTPISTTVVAKPTQPTIQTVN